ncbi:MAG: hypothetical protein INR69_20870 [Mucilaginibacter polytrichastri]|nr:hypothetical protein [Mucilaginibacter polytrichastri]
MKMLPDNDFDDLFRKRVDEFETGFDESAWNDMENRLHRRDRVVWIKRSSVLLLCLFFLGAGGYFLLKDKPAENKFAKTRQGRAGRTDTVKTETDRDKVARPLFADKDPTADSPEKPTQNEPEKYTPITAFAGKDIPKRSTSTDRGKPAHEINPAKEAAETLAAQTEKARQKTAQPVTENTPVTAPQQKTGQLAASVKQSDTTKTSQKPTEVLVSNSKKTSTKEGKSAKKIAVKTTRPVVWSFTFSAGPELSAINKIGGSQPKLQLGLLVNAGISKHVTLSTGFRYGVKKYEASQFNYSFAAPRPWQSQITGIDASCNVLELPMRVSYALGAGKRSDFKINGGISSYFMLKEVYDFAYTPQSGRPEFYLIKNNANQHVLSVAEISATYSIRPKNSPIQFGIEPYLKLPLAGVGEGKVKLNSTGVNLNITYGLSKK